MAKDFTKIIEEALKIKQNRKIYMEPQYNDMVKAWGEDEVDEDMKLCAVVADLKKVQVESRTGWPDYLDGRAYIPDWTPNWLYDIVELFGAGWSMESIAEFPDEETMEAFKQVCDDVNE